MEKSDLRTLWNELEHLLDEALALEHARIAPDQAQVIREFIDHNEFGLAYEQLTDALAELETPPQERTTSLVEQARRLMQPQD